MGSFYGSSFGGGTGSSGGGGTSNYNELTNKPIINLFGTEGTPIILSKMATGYYMIQGEYIYTSKDTDIKRAETSTLAHIFLDAGTALKGAKLEVIENENLYFHLLSFKEDETCTFKKIAVNNSSAPEVQESVIFTKEDLLPTGSEGEEQKLYVTEDRIIQYLNNEIVNLSGGNIIKWEDM